MLFIELINVYVSPNSPQPQPSAIEDHGYNTSPMR